MVWEEQLGVLFACPKSLVSKQDFAKLASAIVDLIHHIPRCKIWLSIGSSSAARTVQALWERHPFWLASVVHILEIKCIFIINWPYYEAFSLPWCFIERQLHLLVKRERSSANVKGILFPSLLPLFWETAMPGKRACSSRSNLVWRLFLQSFYPLKMTVRNSAVTWTKEVLNQT